MRTNLPAEAKWVAGASIAVIVVALVMLAVAGGSEARTGIAGAIADWAERVGLTERE